MTLRPRQGFRAESLAGFDTPGLKGSTRRRSPCGVFSPFIERGPDPGPPSFSFHGRPDWTLVGQDDSLVAKFGLTTAGSAHRTEKVVRGFNDGLPIEAFVHRWQTTHTESSTDSNGSSQTRTVTDHHSEVVTAVLLPFDFPPLAVGMGAFSGGGRGGQKVRFESAEFNGYSQLSVVAC